MVVIKKAFIISTGTELMLGLAVDTNSVFLSSHLTQLGFKVVGQYVIGDDEKIIENAFRLGISSADIIVASGGLGPTLDDLTKEVLCKVIDKKMELRPKEVKKIESIFKMRNRAMPSNNLKQAMFPLEAKLLNNDFGTASGMTIETEGKIIALLPGPPRELEPMYLKYLEPYLQEYYSLSPSKDGRKTLKVMGLGESQVEELLNPLINNATDYYFAFLAIDGEVHIKITVNDDFEGDYDRVLEQARLDIKKIIGDNVFAEEDVTLAQIVADKLRAANKSLALAESCTGGLLSKMITDFSGISDNFWGAVVTYSNEAKINFLDVNEQTLVSEGSVSEETAIEMATNLQKISGADIALSITGIAGPEGGNEKKPVGLVYIAWADCHACHCKKLQFLGNRESVRMLAAKTALDILRRFLGDV